MKTCRDCGVEKSLEDFHRHPQTADKRFGHCKECHKARGRKWHANNLERSREINRVKAKALRDRDPAAAAAYNRAVKLWTKYRITPEDWDRLYDEQLGRCAVCHCTLADVKTCVDHDHATGKVRGLLCNVCNQGLGYFGDDPDRLRRAAEYLLGAAEAANREGVVSQ